uniref:Uncharacterized protein n=1 Tax=Octopus bimaculoides TaxID=37653 RepID=A0A0L8G1F9_OCTBM
MATKKRKVDDECRIFNKEWGEKYFFVETNDQKASCLICNESVVVMKDTIFVVTMKQNISQHILNILESCSPRNLNL